MQRRRTRPAAALALVVIALAPTAVLATAGAAHADVDDFSYSSYDVEMRLGLTDDGRARLDVTETWVAQFPEADQNRGIVRGIPLRYEGASTEISDISVTDENGDPVVFETDEDEVDDEDYTVLSIDDDTYKHGATTYAVSYTVENVAFAPDGGEGTPDEFYWDLLPGATAQPIAEATATIVVDPAIAGALTGETRCFTGAYGSEEQCELQRDGDVFSTALTERAPDQEWTVALQFEPGTFARPYIGSETPFAGAVGWISGAVAAIGIAIPALLRRRWRHAPGRGIVVAQYEADPRVPPRIAAALLGGGAGSRVFPAEVLALAVDGSLRLVAKGEDEFVVERTGEPPAGDDATSVTLRGAFAALFPKDRTVNELSDEDEKLHKRIERLGKGDKKRLAPYLTQPEDRVPSIAGRVSAAVGAVIGLGLLIACLVLDVGPIAVLVLVATIAHVVLSLALSARPRLRTAAGSEAREHLEGLREFIELAEADRLRVLQSVSGAERVDVGDDRAVVRLYERLLPWAVLFGQEKSWSDALAVRYEALGAPGWWTGGDGFSTGLFIGSLSHVNQRLEPSRFAPAGTSSGSSAFSSGGGFAGGGGGGGFSGGR
ncbi:DUF2207 family protein [Microbacterium marinilacus]|uniref:DUF2207 domain-containing protein n=1 Tax=Microbacterium marinilacus TaxID=415209 RepID=A0ABP7BU36_9MICO|nr:DUF2207 domain-containing protein [Microbacterium marinilacus]MBY0688194.1 DUF2207 domain-containing protein [Microbacterium marinilacus]